MQQSELLRALANGHASWTAARALVPGVVDLADCTLDLPFAEDVWDLSGCRLARASIGSTSSKLIRLNIGGSDLTGATFRKGLQLALAIDVGSALTGASLVEITLSDTDLGLLGAARGLRFFRSSLRSVRFHGTLEQVDFSRTFLDRVDFTDATLIDCEMSATVAAACDFSDAIVRFAGPTGSTFEKASFTDCRFADVRFGGSPLTTTQFLRCDLRRAKELVFDDTVVRDSVMSPDADDGWSLLRRKYSGTHMLFNLLATSIFFLPFVLQALYWTTVNLAQSDLSDALTAARAVIVAEPRTASSAAALQLVDRIVDPRLTHCVRPLRATIDAPGDPACMPLWQVLLGVHQGPVAVVVGLLLLVYNACRIVLTVRIGPLRDDERDSFHTPTLAALSWLIPLHRLVSVLMVVAFAAAIFHIGLRLALPVWINPTTPGAASNMIGYNAA